MLVCLRPGTRQRRERRRGDEFGNPIRWTVGSSLAARWRVLSARWNVLAGEIIYNLRTALEYVVHEVGWLDSTVRPITSQFPIEDHPQTINVGRGKRKGLWDRRGTWLKSLNDTHVTFIEKLQPYNGVEWTRRLRDLSNQDKHRELIFIGTDEKPTSTPIQQAHPQAVDDAMDVDAVSTFDVTFDDGAPVVETLEEIKREVSAVIDAFDGDFQK